MRVAPKVMHPTRSCWPTMPEADGGMAVEAEPPHQFSTTLRCQAAEAQSDKTASDTEMHMKQRGVTEFPHAEKK